jgi:hypothetical protein
MRIWVEEFGRQEKKTTMMTPSKKNYLSIASSSTPSDGYRRKTRNGFEIENLVEASKHIAGVMTGINEVAAEADGDDASTVCTVKMKTCSTEALKQKEEVENLVKSTQYMADIIRQLGVFPSDEDEEPAALETPKKIMSFDEHDMETPLVTNTKRPLAGVSSCSSPQGSQFSQSTKTASPPPSSHRQDLYAQLQNEKDEIEQKMVKMAILFELQSPDEEQMFSILNDMKLTSGQHSVADDVARTILTDPIPPPPSSPPSNPVRSSDRRLPGKSKDSSSSTSANWTNVDTPAKLSGGLLPSRIVRPKDAGGTRSEEEEDSTEPNIELVASSMSSETELSHPTIDDSNDSSVGYSEEVLKQHYAVDDLVRSTEAMAEALRELEKAQYDSTSLGAPSASVSPSVDTKTQLGATASISSQMESSHDSPSAGSGPSGGYGEEALKQHQEIDDVIRNTESMVEALRELGRAQNENVALDPTSSPEYADDPVVSLGSTLEKARSVTTDTMIQKSRRLLRRPKGARSLRRRQMEKRIIVSKILRVLISPLLRYRYLTPLLIAILITWFSSSQSERAFSTPLVQQLARDTCAKFTL